MAYQKVEGVNTYTGFGLFAQDYIRPFLEANGWLFEHQHYTAVADWSLVMSKGGIAFRLSGSYYGLYIHFDVGTAWNGTAIVNSCNYTNVYTDTRNTIMRIPQDVWLIANENTFYVVVPAFRDRPDNIRAAWFGCGYLNKFGTYNGGIFRSLSLAGLSNTAGQYNTVMTGDFGYVGAPPYMWCTGQQVGWYVDVQPTYSELANSIGRTNTSSFATPFVPMYSIVRNNDIGRQHVAGTYPDILCCYSRGMHESGSIIDHQGSEWLLFGSASYILGRYDVISNVFRLN